jgi:hypothetical protein
MQVQVPTLSQAAQQQQQTCHHQQQQCLQRVTCLMHALHLHRVVRQAQQQQQLWRHLALLTWLMLRSRCCQAGCWGCCRSS